MSEKHLTNDKVLLDDFRQINLDICLKLTYHRFLSLLHVLLSVWVTHLIYVRKIGNHNVLILGDLSSCFFL